MKMGTYSEGKVSVEVYNELYHYIEEMKKKYNFLLWPEYSDKIQVKQKDKIKRQEKDKEPVARKDFHPKNLTLEEEHTKTLEKCCPIFKAHLNLCPLSMCNFKDLMIKNGNKVETEVKGKEIEKENQTPFPVHVLDQSKIKEVKETKKPLLVEEKGKDTRKNSSEEEKKYLYVFEMKSDCDQRKKNNSSSIKQNQHKPTKGNTKKEQEQEDVKKKTEKREEIKKKNIQNTLFVIQEEETLNIPGYHLIGPTSTQSLDKLSSDFEFSKISEQFLCLDQLHYIIHCLFTTTNSNYFWTSQMFDTQNRSLHTSSSEKRFYTKWALFLMQRINIGMFNELPQNFFLFISDYTLAIQDVKTALEELLKKGEIKCTHKYTTLEIELMSSSMNESDLRCQFCEGPEYCSTRTCTCPHFFLYVLKDSYSIVRELAQSITKCQNFFLKLKQSISVPEQEKSNISWYHMFWGISERILSIQKKECLFPNMKEDFLPNHHLL